eukprot:TRINITY_DN6377_c1_g1_i2.p1 TRINITY_DN6377_c1_g1~~TRINITY_DN6377_c1_g1_i2.p1  ORF type:complete len:624 (+),score=90.54 TRINITY_DN6377_c1_g1_i2:240-1874(+)
MKKTKKKGFMQGEGLGLLLGEHTTTSSSEEEGSTEEEEESLKRQQDNTPSDTLFSAHTSSYTPSVVVAQQGQFRAIRSDAVILESLKFSLQEIQHSAQPKQTVDEISSVVREGGVMRRNVSVEILRQNVEEVVKRISSDTDIQHNHQEEQQAVLVQDLDLPPAVQNYLEDGKDLQMRAEQFEELPPDFDNRSVISETRSMPDIKRSESPVARPPIGGWNGGLVYCESSNMRRRGDKERVQMLLRCTSTNTANSPQLKRPILFSDKLPSKLPLKGPTAMYVPHSPPNSFAPLLPHPRIQSIEETEQEQFERMSAQTLKAESDDNRSESFDVLVSEMKRKEQVQQRLISQGSLKDPPQGNSLQANYQKNKFNLEKQKSRNQRPSSQSSDTSSISEPKYQELLNTWKSKHREFIKRTQKQHSRRYGGGARGAHDEQECMSQTGWMNLRNCLSTLPEAQEVFNRLQEDDLQSVQSEPLNLQTVNLEILQQNVNQFSTSPVSRSRCLLKIIEEGRGDDINIYPDRVMLPSGQVTVFTASSSDGTLLHFS